MLACQVGLFCCLLGPMVLAQTDPEGPPQVRAAIIACRGLIDDAQYESIQRRTREALDQGADYLIYEIGTYGGLVQSADSISKFLLDTAASAHTVAYIRTEAISAGAMISVSCRDIVMRENTTIGACAPITMGGTLEGVEREKTESFIRAIFDRAAAANHYPRALLRAMVSMQIEVYRIRNIETGAFEYFETPDLPTDPNRFDLAGKKVVVKEGELLTVASGTAEEYGIARTVVTDLDGVLAFLARGGTRSGLSVPRRTWSPPGPNAWSVRSTTRPWSGSSS